MKKKIAVSKSNSSFQNYVNWIEETGFPYEILDWEKNNLGKINECSSLLLTGGADIFPEFYSDWDEGKSRKDFLPERDGFEFKLFDYALQNKLPVLAICRGMQLVNCRLNGNLLSDIETIRGVNHKKIGPGEDRYHQVNIRNGTLLGEIIGEQSGTVNSSHHQGIDRVGEELIISARAGDGIVEGLEWEDKAGKPFLLAVQWHPERMNDMSSPFTRKILDRFAEESDK